MAWFSNAIGEEKVQTTHEGYGNPIQRLEMSQPRPASYRQQEELIGRTLSDEELTFFDFEPHYRKSLHGQRQVIPNVMGQQPPWGNAVHHPMSPPNSAVFPSPKPWSTSTFENTCPRNILTDIDPVNVQSHYGQVTPPDDVSSNMFDGQQEQVHPETPSKKRKRTPAPLNTPKTALASKRTRKNAARSRQPEPPTADATGPEMARRSKFLERNRQAASKCRQKKKTWIDSLEARARDLQSLNSSLHLEIASLKCEMLHLQLEMVRHRDCDGCTIQELIERDAGYFDEATKRLVMFEKEKQAERDGSRTSNGTEDAPLQESDTTEENVEIKGQPSAVSMSSEDILGSLLSTDFMLDVSQEDAGNAS